MRLDISKVCFDFYPRIYSAFDYDELAFNSSFNAACMNLLSWYSNAVCDFGLVQNYALNLIRAYTAKWLNDVVVLTNKQNVALENNLSIAEELSSRYKRQVLYEQSERKKRIFDFLHEMNTTEGTRMIKKNE